MQKIETIHHPDLIIGERGEVSERARFGPNFYGGWIILACSPGDFATLMPWILGADASGTTYALDETLQAFGVLIDKVTDTYNWQDCYVNRAVFHGKQAGFGGPPNWITVALQIFGKSYGAAETFPAQSLAVTGQYVPMVFEDVTLTLQSATRDVKAFTLDIHNHLQVRYVNSTDPSTICPSRRTVKLQTVHPFDGDTDDLYDQALAGAAGTLLIANGNVSMSFAFATLQVPAETPKLEGKREVDLVLNMDARKSSGTAAVICTIDSTP